MIGRRSIIGLTLLSALVVCAFAAQSASAAFSPATKLTAYTCVPKAEGEFKDAHCDTKAGNPATEGKFSHVVIPKNETTEITVTNEATANNTTEHTKAIFHATLAGVEFTLTATKVHGTGFIHNVEPSAGVHKATGTLLTKFTEVTVDGLTGCSVVEPIEVNASFEGVEEGANMGVEFKPVGANFAEIKFTGASCAVNGLNVKVKGSFIGTGGTGAATNNSGATSVFEGGAMSNLLLGGNPASFTATLTTKMVNGNPIALTTAT